MEQFIEIFANIFDHIITYAFILLVVAALGRAIYKTIKGESITIPSVGVANDLPSSVTGINKHNDIHERSGERHDKKIDG